ncbi:MAG: lysylphosphatidylglycerol synthase transmembrane domain-containing protein [Ignavibacteriaceae bacterium]
MESILTKYFGSNSSIVKNKKLIYFLLKLFIAAGLLTYILITVKLTEIWIAIEGANITFLSAAILLSVLNIYLQFVKWKLTCNILLGEKSRSKIFISLLHGLAAGVFTPARIGEYFGRAIVFKNKPVYKVALATLLDKFFPLLMVAFFGSISSILFIHFEYAVTPYITISLFIIFFSLFYLFFYLLFNKRFWDSFIFSKLRKSVKLNYLIDKLKELKDLDKKYSVKMIAVSLTFYFCFLLQYALLVAAFSNHLHLVDYFWAGNLIMFTKTIIPPVSLGELGIREGASVYFISRLGESASVGFNASIFLFFINVLIPSIIGSLLLLKKSND